MKYPGLDPPGTEQRHEIILHSLPPVRICVPNQYMVETKRTQPIRSILNKLQGNQEKKNRPEQPEPRDLAAEGGKEAAAKRHHRGADLSTGTSLLLCHLVSLVPSRTWTISSSVLFDMNRLNQTIPAWILSTLNVIW